MRLRTNRDRLFGSHCRKQPTPHGPREAAWCSRLASPKNAHRYTKIPWIHWILSLLYPQLLENSETTTRSDEESSNMGLGTKTIPSFRRTEDEDVQKPSPDATSKPPHQLMAWAPYSRRREEIRHLHSKNVPNQHFTLLHITQQPSHPLN